MLKNDCFQRMCFDFNKSEDEKVIDFSLCSDPLGIFGVFLLGARSLLKNLWGMLDEIVTVTVKEVCE